MNCNVCSTDCWSSNSTYTLIRYVHALVQDLVTSEQALPTHSVVCVPSQKSQTIFVGNPLKSNAKFTGSPAFASWSGCDCEYISSLTICFFTTTESFAFTVTVRHYFV